jgi:hypothetical protein
MTDFQSLPELVSVAQGTAKSSQDRISEILSLTGSQKLSAAQTKELTAETIAIELAAVDVFTLFEARMQHHFKRGPLSRKVKEALLAAGQADLANRLNQHYLAINVLKHGTGASYRELLNNKGTVFVVKQSADVATNESEVSTGLIDVTEPHFFDGLVETILESFHFLENR